MSINNLSFATTVLSIVVILGVSLYGAVRLFRAKKDASAVCVLALFPIWLVAQVMLFVVYDQLKVKGIAKKAYHFDYVATPVFNVLGIALAVWLVAYLLRPDPQIGEGGGVWAWILQPRKLWGLLFLGLGIAAMSTFFPYSGVLFIIVGVSLLMDVRLWRR